MFDHRRICHFYGEPSNSYVMFRLSCRLSADIAAGPPGGKQPKNRKSKHRNKENNNTGKKQNKTLRGKKTEKRTKPKTHTETKQKKKQHPRPFFRDDEGVLAEQPLLCSVCTSAAPNASQAPHGAAQAAMQADLWVGSRGGSRGPVGRVVVWWGC